MSSTVVLVTRAGLGTTAAADAAFGIEMLELFFHSLETQKERPRAVCFYTEAVTLLRPESPVGLSLKLLERLGIDVYACQTCLDYYQVGDDIVAGQRSNMAEIVRLLSEADKVITI
jgi:intracellular sulfur oxidation DsrE/DsrF family protein